MTHEVANVSVLGSTGSIGRNTLEVIAASHGTLRSVGLSAHSRLDLLLEQAHSVHPRWIVAADPISAGDQDWSTLPGGVELLVGPDALETIARRPEVDIVVAAIVGSAGLRGTWAAVEAGKTVALANKETMVVAGPLVTDLARRTGARIVPVDSEHSAVFQAMQAGRREDVKRVILTASGGPFRNHTTRQMADVTIADALRHPTWTMGPKITIDSATMMNKALEIIEARWLFDLRPDQIDVVVHPQSIVHSMVELRDGSTLAQLSAPDMRLPIGYALGWPDRSPVPFGALDWSSPATLTFEPPERGVFRCIDLAYHAGISGGSAPAWLSAANEVAVDAFLAGAMAWSGIADVVAETLDAWRDEPVDQVESVLAADEEARARARAVVARRTGEGGSAVALSLV